jgi:recombination protein RecT
MIVDNAIDKTTPAQNQVAAPSQKTIAEMVLTKIEAFKNEGSIKIPKDYSPENALRSSFLILSDMKVNNTPVLNGGCTQESIANALLKMVIEGLSPVKRQCSFITYGNKLSCQREYAGNIALAKRFGGLKSIVANAIFEGDEFKYAIDPETGIKKVIEHNQTIDSMGSLNLKGAYAIVELEDGRKMTEVMNMNQIRAAWNQGPMKGNSPAHKNFPDQMSCKTVINRACKLLINSSDDSELFEDDQPLEDKFTSDVKNEIKEKGNKTEIGFQDELTEHDQVPGSTGQSNDAVTDQSQNTDQPSATEKPPF